MGWSRWARRLAPVVLVASGASAIGCGMLLDFPDRALDDEVAEAGGDAGLPDTGTTTDTGTATDTGTDVGDSASLQDTYVPPADAGAPSVALSRSAIDFGPVLCGAAAPADQEITISNIGGSSLTWTGSLSATPQFAISGAAAGTVAPNASGTLKISSLAISALAAAGDAVQATLTIGTNDPNKPTTDIPLKITAAGGSLLVVPSTVALGESAVTVAAPSVAVELKNTGNAPITLGLSQPANAQFGLSWTGAPADVMIAPGASVPSLAASFTPTSSGSFVTTAPITLKSGALCGTNPSQITLTGKGASAAPVVTPGLLDFGSVDCGTQGTAAAVTIKHSGTSSTQTFDWSAVVSGPFKINKNSGALNNGQSDTITVTPDPIPAKASVTPNGFGGSLTITTSGAGAVGDQPHVVSLSMTARGAILKQSTTAINFGSVPLSKKSTNQFTVTNTGNAFATVSYDVSDPAFSITPQQQPLGGGSSFTAMASLAPQAAQPYSGTATMTVPQGTVLCDVLPSAISLAGQGSYSVTLTPSSLDFGLVDCGTKAADKTITLKNTGTSSFYWTATLGKTGPNAVYTVTPASRLTGSKLAPDKEDVLTITPIAIPGISTTADDFYADTLTITTSPSPLQSPYVAAIHMTARGAVLSFNPSPTLGFAKTKVKESSSETLFVVNSGNAPATVTMSVSGTNASDFTFSSGSNPVTVNSSSSTSSNMTFTPAVEGARSATVKFTSVSSSTVMCSALDTPSVALSGSGEGVPSAQLTPSNVDFGKVNCGAQATSQPITLKNNGTAAYTWTANLGGPGAAFYTVTPSSSGSTTLQPDTQTQLTITPSAIPSVSSTADDLYAATLTITTTPSLPSPVVANLHMTAQGAVLSFEPVGGLDFGDTNVGSTSAPLDIVVKNSGNVQATGVSLSLTGNDPGDFNVSSSSFTVDAGSQTSRQATFAPLATASRSATVKFASASSTVMCSALDAPSLALSGNGTPP